MRKMFQLLLLKDFHSVKIFFLPSLSALLILAFAKKVGFILLATFQCLEKDTNFSTIFGPSFGLARHFLSQLLARAQVAIMA